MSGSLGPVKDRLERYGLFDRLGTASFFPTVGPAVGRPLEATAVPREDASGGAEGRGTRPVTGRLMLHWKGCCTSARRGIAGSTSW